MQAEIEVVGTESNFETEKLNHGEEQYMADQVALAYITQKFKLAGMSLSFQEDYADMISQQAYQFAREFINQRRNLIASETDK